MLWSCCLHYCSFRHQLMVLSNVGLAVLDWAIIIKNVDVDQLVIGLRGYLRNKGQYYVFEPYCDCYFYGALYSRTRKEDKNLCSISAHAILMTYCYLNAVIKTANYNPKAPSFSYKTKSYHHCSGRYSYCCHSNGEWKWRLRISVSNFK